MITYALLGVFYVTALGFIALIESVMPSPPSWWSDATTAVGQWWSIVPDPMKYFLPIGPLVVAGGVYFTLQISLGVMALIRRILLAVIP